MIGLTFLVFLSSGIFISLNSTTAAVTKEYNRIGKSGNLHQFTVSELYESSTPKYADDIETYKDNEDKEQYTGLYNQNHLVKSSDNKILPYVQYVETDSEGYAKFKMWYTLDISNLRSTSAVRNFYIQTMANTAEYQKNGLYIEPEVEFKLAPTTRYLDTLITYCNTLQVAYGKDHPSAKSTLDAQTIKTNIAAIDYGSSDVQKQLSNAGNQVVSLSSTDSTPMQQYLSDSDGLGNDVKYRKFRSINIDNSADSVFYKGVLSNPTDTIDKMVLINSDKIAKEGSVQWNNFTDTDANFGILDFTDPEEWSLGQTLKYLPESGSLTKSTPDIHFIKKIFLLAKCDYGTAQSSCPVWAYVDLLTTDKKLPKTKEECQLYWLNNFNNINSLLDKEHSENEFVYIKDYRVTVQWQGTAPSVAFINNWTSFFAVSDP